MPSKSPEQKRLMQAAAHDAAFAKQAGVPQDVAREFDHLDHIAQLKRNARCPPMKRRIPR